MYLLDLDHILPESMRTHEATWTQYRWNCWNQSLWWKHQTKPLKVPYVSVISADSVEHGEFSKVVTGEK
jgi:hypothetical protein